MLKFNHQKSPKLRLAGLQAQRHKKIIKQFAAKFDFTYLGTVSSLSEHDLVRGASLAPEHQDTNYSVGSFKNRDITVVERQATLNFPGKPPETYNWLIMQFDLRQSGLPRIFIDARHHNEQFYVHFFLTSSEMEDASSLFVRHDPLFTRQFKVFAKTTRFDDAWSVLTSEMTAMLAHHFRQFAYEIDDDRLYIYAVNPSVNLQVLQEMMRVGNWLADQLDSNEAK